MAVAMSLRVLVLGVLCALSYSASPFFPPPPPLHGMGGLADPPLLHSPLKLSLSDTPLDGNSALTPPNTWLDEEIPSVNLPADMEKDTPSAPAKPSRPTKGKDVGKFGRCVMRWTKNHEESKSLLKTRTEKDICRLAFAYWPQCTHDWSSCVPPSADADDPNCAVAAKLYPEYVQRGLTLKAWCYQCYGGSPAPAFNTYDEATYIEKGNALLTQLKGMYTFKNWNLISGARIIRKVTDLNAIKYPFIQASATANCVKPEPAGRITLQIKGSLMGAARATALWDTLAYVIEQFKPCWLKIDTPHNERPDSILIKYPLSRKTFATVCETLAASPHKANLGKDLPVLQYRGDKADCLASLATYEGGASFGDTLCTKLEEAITAQQSFAKFLKSFRKDFSTANSYPSLK